MAEQKELVQSLKQGDWGPCRSTFSPVPNANPQVAEEAGPAVAAVSFAKPLVPSKLLQLAQAVGEQQVRQLLISEAEHVLRGAGHPAGGS